MEALLSTLPDGERNLSQLTESVGGSNDNLSIISSVGLDRLSSNNGVSNLLKGGDSLSVLRGRSASALTTSAASRRSKSSSKSSRPSMSSRGRKLKPHEVDAFLSVNAVTPQVPHINCQQDAPEAREGEGRTIHVDQNYSALPSDWANDGSSDMRRKAAEESNVGVIQDDIHLQTHGREDYTAVCSSCKRDGNVLVKSPFKHEQWKRPKSKSCSPHLGHLLKEKTFSAMSRVKVDLIRHAAEDRKKAAGRLLKGRLKPMCPVKIEGPSIKSCRGIISDVQSYSPPPSRCKGRRDQMLDSILREYAGADGERAESLHQTSVASSESDRSSYQGGARGDGDIIEEVTRINSNPDIMISSPGDFTGFVQASSHSVVVVDRPNTACSRVSAKHASPAEKSRPVSSDINNKNVRFSNSASMESNIASHSLSLEKADESGSGNDLKHKTDTKDKRSDTDLDGRKYRTSKVSCKPANFFLNGASDDDESEEDEDGESPDRKKQFVQTDGNKSVTSVGLKSQPPNYESGKASQSDEPPQQQQLGDSELSLPEMSDFELSDENLNDPTKTNTREVSSARPGQRTACFKVNVTSMQNKHPNKYILARSLNPDSSRSDDFVAQKTHVFNFVASHDSSHDFGNIEESHVSAEFNMTPRDTFSSDSINASCSASAFTFESLDAELLTVQNDIRHLLENQEALDELETHREHNLDDLHLKKTSCSIVGVHSDESSVSDLSDSSDSEEEVAVITLDSEGDEIAKHSYREAHYSEALLSANTSQFRFGLDKNDFHSRCHLPASCWIETQPRRDKTHANRFMHSLPLDAQSDSGCGSSHGDETSRHSDFHEEDENKAEERDVSKLKVVATAKDLMKMRREKSFLSLPSQHPPLCFRINARPPTGKLFYFSYGTEMNQNRLSTYIQREVRERLWGVLYGFKIAFNKKGLDPEAGGFPNVEADRGSSVEGCVYLLTPTELQRLDRCVGYPQHYEHVMFPVWVSNCLDPNNYGVAQDCVPALMYMAQNQWLHDGLDLKADYSVNQCLKSADLLTPAYQEHLYSQSATA